MSVSHVTIGIEANVAITHLPSGREAIRCLKRQLARTVYTTLKNEPLLT